MKEEANKPKWEKLIEYTEHLGERKEDGNTLNYLYLFFHDHYGLILTNGEIEKIIERVQKVTTLNIDIGLSEANAELQNEIIALKNEQDKISRKLSEAHLVLYRLANSLEFINLNKRQAKFYLQAKTVLKDSYEINHILRNKSNG